MMKIESVLKFFNPLADNEYKLKKGYALFLNGDSYNHYSNRCNSLVFYEFEFNFSILKTGECDIKLFYHGKELKYVIDRFI